MTPSKQEGNNALRNPGTGTNTVSGIVASVDGEDFDYQLVDDDNLTLKNSEHSRAHLQHGVADHEVASSHANT